MDLREFATDFMDSINASVEMESKNFEEELTSSILDYIADSEEIGAPTVCCFKKTRASLNAFDFNEESNSLDLFILVQPDTFLGKVNNNKIDNAFNRLTRFFEESLDGSLLKDNTTKNDEVYEAIELIKSAVDRDVTTVREYVLTNGLNNEYDLSTVEMDNGIILEQHLWDMQHIYQQDRIRTGKEQIEIDFPAAYSTELQCLKMMQTTSDVEAYLAIIPGITLAKIYKQYQQAILEKNVRTFLQLKAKVNKGIHDTLHDEPEMFFSYNNGISTTASEVKTEERNGVLFITNLYNWQIVNGGQTTATIAATFSEKGVDLSKVFVPVKISVIKDKEVSQRIVPKISEFANKQTAVKDSDFSSNDPYLVLLEQFSRSEWVPNGNSKGTTKWYIERARGQYMDDLSQQSGLNEKIFRTSYPKSNKLTKTDVAKLEMCWEQKPDSVCNGAEKNYKIFVKLIQAASPTVTAIYYKRLIAKAILFNEIDRLVKEAQLGGYKSNMNSYLLASVSLLTKKILDLDNIWEHQRIPEDLKSVVRNLIPIVWKHLTEGSVATNSQISNVNEWSKKSDCWESLKLKLASFPDVDGDLLLSPDRIIDVTPLTQAQKDIMDKAWSIKPSTWFGLSSWAKQHNELTPMERRNAYSYGIFKSNGRPFKYEQSVAALRLYNKAKEKGFES